MHTVILIMLFWCHRLLHSEGGVTEQEIALANGEDNLSVCSEIFFLYIFVFKLLFLFDTEIVKLLIYEQYFFMCKSNEDTNPRSSGNALQFI